MIPTDSSATASPWPFFLNMKHLWTFSSYLHGCLWHTVLMLRITQVPRISGNTPQHTAGSHRLSFLPYNQVGGSWRGFSRRAPTPERVATWMLVLQAQRFSELGRTLNATSFGANIKIGWTGRDRFSKCFMSQSKRLTWVNLTKVYWVYRHMQNTVSLWLKKYPQGSIWPTG